MVFSRSDPKNLKVVPPEIKPEPPKPPTIPNLDARSVIGSDLSIEGPSITMRCKGTLTVNGSIEANLHCVELIIGEQAMIVGAIAANKVAVAGHVNGSIVGDSVVLQSSAHVEGDISSRSLSIEQGASFDGRSRKVTDPAEVAPQLDANASVAAPIYHHSWGERAAGA
jgi:cytoskeletal protein CcmA (bactofilin family)